MSDNLSKTVHGDFDAVFREVTQSSPVSWITQGELRLFHLNIRNNKFNPEEMKKLLYRNIGDYVFSRAKIEHFKVTGDAFAIVSQALRVLQKNGGADIKGTGSELGELLLYSFLEEKLKAPKLMSRVELSTDAKQYASSCDGIHLLTKEIDALREKKATVVTKDAEQEMLRKRINEMRHFLQTQTSRITEYDEQLVRRLIEKSQFMMIN